jgi:hypothetical protein
MFEEVMKHFEREASVSVMARVALEGTITSRWVDEVFAAHRQWKSEGTAVLDGGGRDDAGVSEDSVRRCTPRQPRPSTCRSRWQRCTINSTAPSPRSCTHWYRGAPNVWSLWLRHRHMHPACPAGVCVCSTAIIWRPARNGWRRCASRVAASADTRSVTEANHSPFLRMIVTSLGLALPPKRRRPRARIDIACSPLPTRIVAPRVPDCMRFQPAGAG